MNVSDLLDMLEGAWRLSRSIEAEGAVMQGRAQFSRLAQDALLYREEGVLTLHNGQTVRCTRSYRFLAQGESLQIVFNDAPDAGKPFVTLRFSDAPSGVLIANDEHLCVADTYSVRYCLRLPAGYETDISVSGPQKKYRAVTRYSKIDDDQALISADDPMRQPGGDLGNQHD